MLRFIFGKKETPTVKTETQRESFERVMSELNGLLDEQTIKPSITVDMGTGAVVLTLPEQLADEALSLPAPEEANAPSVEAENQPATEASKADADTPKA